MIWHWRHPQLRRFLYTYSGHTNIHKETHKEWGTIVLPRVKGVSIPITFLSIIWWDKGCFILDTFKNSCCLSPSAMSKCKLNIFESFQGSGSSTFLTYKFYLSTCILILTRYPTLMGLSTAKDLECI